MARAKDDLVTLTGVVQESLAGDMFSVKLDIGGTTVRTKISGKMRKHRIWLTVGDKVTLEFSTTDMTLGRIVRRDR